MCYAALVPAQLTQIGPQKAWHCPLFTVIRLRITVHGIHNYGYVSQKRGTHYVGPISPRPVGTGLCTKYGMTQKYSRKFLVLYTMALTIWLI